MKSASSSLVPSGSRFGEYHNVMPIAVHEGTLLCPQPSIDTETLILFHVAAESEPFQTIEQLVSLERRGLRQAKFGKEHFEM